MNLGDYLKHAGIGQAKFAATLGVSQSMVWQWINGHRPVHVRHGPAIERATGGAVRRQDLRPDDWHLIWPELAEREAA